MLESFAAFQALLENGRVWSSGQPMTALALAFGWGLCSCLISPCHLAAIPIMAAHAATTRNARSGHYAEHAHGSHEAHGTNAHADSPEANSALRRETTLACAAFGTGYFLAVLALGSVGIVLGLAVESGDEGGHWWFVPAGALLLLFAVLLWRRHDCGPPEQGQGLLQQITALARRHAQSPVAGMEHLASRAAKLLRAGGGVLLGAVYGLLSGSCSLAFMAPVLVLGLTHGPLASLTLTLAFALGHSLPLVLAGFAAPLARRALLACHPGHSHNTLHQHHSIEVFFRKVVAAGLFASGVVFVLHPFWH